MQLIITGLLVGIVSLIPGISGGTIILLSKQEQFIYSIITNYKHNIINLLKLIISFIIGALLFSKIIESLFISYYPETMTTICGFLIFSSIPIIKKQKRLNKYLLSLAIIFILIINNINPNQESALSTIPTFTITNLITFTTFGILNGFITILPGISGSMCLMILGPYYIYKSLLANLSINTLHYVLPLSLFFIGETIGLYLGSKFTLTLLNKYKTQFMSIIIGLIIGSILILIPFEYYNNTDTILRCIMSFISSYIIIELLN